MSHSDRPRKRRLRRSILPELEILERRELLDGTGLSATYFDNEDFTGRQIKRLDSTVAFQWKLGSPAYEIGSETFSARWEGQLEPLHTESYTLYAQSDNGARLWLNDTLIIDSWSDHPLTENIATVSLEAGKRYDIRLEYHEHAGLATMELDWSSPSTAKSTIPQARLYPLPTPWNETDVGSTALPGSTHYGAGTYIVHASGADIGNSADAFHYVYQTLAGDGQIVAHVSSLGQTDGWAKAGVMIRQDLSASSAHATMAITAANGSEFERRLVRGGATGEAVSGDGATPPAWVKLVRAGDTISGYESSDGQEWTFVGSDSMALTTLVYFGLVVSSHNEKLLSSAVFDNVRVTRTATNNPPVLNAVGPKSITEGSELRFQATATDPDVPANKLTFSLTAGAPSGARIDANTGVFTWTPTEGQGPAAYGVTVIVTDDGTPNLSDSESFVVNVVEANTRPTLDPISDKVVIVGTLLTFAASARDADLPANRLQFTLDAGAPAGASINSNTGVFVWVPSAGQASRTYTVTARVTDDGSPNLSDTKTFRVTVGSFNIAPVLNPIGNQVVDELELLAFKASASDSDTLTYSLAAGAPSGASIDSRTGVFGWTPIEGQGPGTYPVTVVVTDNGTPNLSDSETILVTVNEVNAAPILAAIGNKDVTVGGRLSFTASATDSDVPANTLRYSLDKDAPHGASIDDITGAFEWAPGPGQGPASYVVTVRVTDNGSPSLNDFETFTVRVTIGVPNTPPILLPIANKTVNEMTSLSFRVSASDAPADVLTYSLDTGAPAGAIIDPTTGLFGWTPTELQGPGTYPVTVRVTDNGIPRLSSAASFTITVNEVNTPPILAIIGDRTVNAGSLLTFTASASDTDLPLNALSYSLAPGAPAGSSINSETGVFSWRPTSLQLPGIYYLTVLVTDDGLPALADSETISVTVTTWAANLGNRAPVLGSIGNKSVNELTTLTFAATATDPDGDSLTFSLDSGAPAEASIDPNTGVFSWRPSEAQGPGIFDITVRVTDSGSPGLSDSETITVNVAEVNSAPVLGAIGSKAVFLGSQLTFTASATESDTPANTLEFSLDAGAPSGATINAGTGAFSWRPSAQQGVGLYAITVRVTDNGLPALSDSETVTIAVSQFTGQNQSPVILSPVGDYSAAEGEAFSIPFTIFEPDNDVVDYAVEYLVGGRVRPSLPTGASLVTNPTTNEKSFVWWPALNQSGVYDFRFRAVDDKGAAAEKMIHVSILNSIGNPRLSVTTGSGMQTPGSVVVDGTVFPHDERGGVVLNVRVFDPEGQAMTVSGSGLPNMTVRQDSSNPTLYFVESWTTENPVGDHRWVGIYSGTITVTDSSGNHTDFHVTEDVRRTWQHEFETVMVYPKVGQGLVRSLELSLNDGVFEDVVRGSVSFDMQGMVPFLNRVVSIPNDLQYRFVLHSASATGSDIETPVSGVLIGAQTFTWDSRTVNDGAYAMDIALVNGGTGLSDLSRFKHRPLLITVDNQAGPVTGAQWLPTTGQSFARNLGYESTAIEWVRFSGQAQSHAASEPYAALAVAPPGDDAARQTLASTNQWFAEPWLHVHSARFDAIPEFMQTAEGHPVIGFVRIQFPDDPVWAFRYPLTDGGRNDTGISPETALRPNPEGDGFWGLSQDGRFMEITPAGVRTLAGWVTRSDVIPYLPTDLSVSKSTVLQSQKVLVGSFDRPFEMPWDFVPDPQDSKTIYVADTGNQRIAKIDMHGATPVVTTFAGQVGVLGYRDGDRSQALFNSPASVEIVGGVLYVADARNKVVRGINLNTGQVSTVVGNASGNVITIHPGDHVGLSTATLNYTWIRHDSHGNLYATEGGYNWHLGEGKIVRINLQQGQVDGVTEGTRGYRFDVDWRGNVGPVDQLITSGSDREDSLFRLDPQTGMYTKMINEASYPAYLSQADGGGAYSHVVVVDDQTSRFAQTSLYQSDMLVFRPVVSGDIPAPDYALVDRGFHVYHWGTFPEFVGPTPPPGAVLRWDAYYALDDRPTFNRIHGPMGWNRLGNVPTFDELSVQTDAELASYIRSGMGTGVARPEITGRDLQALIYMIRTFSIQGKRERIDPQVIAQHLDAIGLWANESRAPEIRNVQVTRLSPSQVKITWQTDEATLGVVGYGPTEYNGLHSTVETTYSKDHEVVLSNIDLLTNYHFRVISKDLTGNFTTTNDMRFVLQGM